MSELRLYLDRLWDTDRSHDIKTLDWMAKLKSEQTNRINNNEKQHLKVHHKKDRGRGMVIGENAEAQNASNQWHVTKGRAKQRR